MTITLQVEKRDPREKPAALRRAGKLPAVYYGRKHPSTPVTVSEREFEQVFRKAGETTVVRLLAPDGELDALIHDIDRDPVRGTLRHADFYVFEKGQKLRVKVPIEFSGVSPAVKDLGGVLVKVLHELEIEAAPQELPRALSVDISSLAKFGDTILARDVSLPNGVELTTRDEEAVVSVSEPKEEPVEEAPMDISAIEVEKKGKEKAEGEGEGAAAGEAAPKESPGPNKEKG